MSIDAKEDFCFDIQQAQLGSENSDEDTAPPSTLYDPTILALSPDLQAKVAAREARNQEGQATAKSYNNIASTNFHVFSPGVETQKKNPFQVDVDGKTIRTPRENEGNDPETESILCCSGLLPLYHALLILYFMITLTALVCIGLASNEVHISMKSFLGFDTLGKVIISGAYISGSACIFIGILSFICGVIGMFLSYSGLKGFEQDRRWPEVVGRCLLILVTILALALLVVNAFALSKASQKTLYDSLLWTNAVQSEPEYSCNTQRRLDCAGFAIRQCQFDNNGTSSLFCPGHFCIDFCKLGTNIESTLRVCDGCKRPGGSLFEDCKGFETEATLQRPCRLLLNEDLSTSYQKLLAAVTLVCLSLFITIAISSYPSCCA